MVPDFPVPKVQRFQLLHTYVAFSTLVLRITQKHLSKCTHYFFMHLNCYVSVECNREPVLTFQSESETTTWLWSLDELTIHAISASLGQEGMVHQQWRVASDMAQALEKRKASEQERAPDSPLINIVRKERPPIL